MHKWRESELSSLAEISSGGTPSRNVSQYWGGNISWVTPSDITKCQTNYIERTNEKITEKGLAASSATLLPAGTILLTSRATIGEAKISKTPMATNQGFKNLVPRNVVDLVFLFYQVGRLGNEFRRYSAGSTFLEINRKDVGRVLVPHPKSKDIQKKIGVILTTIDQSIEKTESLIKKYQQIKTGLMHDLFTRGIGDDGKLRPPREQAPELYQKTAIGWIPKEWGYCSLEHLLAPVSNNLRSGPFGSALLKSELVENGIPFLGIDNIHVEHFDANYRRFVTPRKYRELIKYAVRPRDVVITIMGTVGRAAVIPKSIGKALSSKHLWTMSLDTEKVIPELICWQLNYAPWVKSWFRRETQGGIMDAIQSKTLRTLVLPVPTFDEQSKILRRYRGISSKIEAEEQLLAKLRKQKNGLMHDLLTGKADVSTVSAETALH